MNLKGLEPVYEKLSKTMTRISEIRKMNSIQILFFLLLAILSFGVSFSLAFFINVYPSEGLELVLSKQGFEYFLLEFSPSISILDLTFKFLVSVSTIGGIFIAVKSYHANQYSSSISNHISNIKTFSEFLQSEVQKLPLISPQSLSSFFWYNEIFPDSKSGSLKISTEYLAKLNCINNVINESNRIYSSSEKPDFSYQKHQTNMINALAKIGVDIARLSRNDFYTCESEILKLIDLTNLEFCGIRDENYVMLKRKYI